MLFLVSVVIQLLSLEFLDCVHLGIIVSLFVLPVLSIFAVIWALCIAPLHKFFEILSEKNL